MGRAPCCDKANVKKGPWSPEEDATLKSYIDQNGTGGNWIALPQKIGLKRCGKSCRLRWLNYLRPNIKHGGFTEEEENIICSLYINIGSRWSIIAAQLPGRTDNDIKNYWNTRLKKKLMAKQRKEQHAVSSAGLLEHELKREISDSFLVHQTPNQQMPSYWAESPLVTGLNTMHPAQVDAHLGNQDQMTRLLMKLGGQFYEDPQILVNNSGMSYQYNPIQDQLYPNFFPNYTQLSNPEYDAQGGAGVVANPASTFPADIEAYLNNLMQFEGSTSYSGGVDGGNSTSTPSSASVGGTSWGEMSSLVNTPVSDFDTYYQQGMLQKVADQ